MANILHAIRNPPGFTNECIWDLGHNVHGATVVARFVPAAQDPVTLVAFTFAEMANGASVSNTIPLETQAGDTIVALVYRQTAAFTNPSGYATVIDQQAPEATNARFLRMIAKEAVAGDAGALLTVSHGISDWIGLTILVLRNANGWVETAGALQETTTIEATTTPSVPYSGEGWLAVAGVFNFWGYNWNRPGYGWTPASYSKDLNNRLSAAVQARTMEKGDAALLESWGHTVTQVHGSILAENLANYDLLLVGTALGRDEAHEDAAELDGLPIPILTFCRHTARYTFGMSSSDTWAGRAEIVRMNLGERNPYREIFIPEKKWAYLVTLAFGSSAQYYPAGDSERGAIVTKHSANPIRVFSMLCGFDQFGPEHQKAVEVFGNYLDHALGVVPAVLEAPDADGRVFTKVSSHFSWNPTPAGQPTFFQQTGYMFRRTSLPPAGRLWNQVNAISTSSSPYQSVFSPDGKYLLTLGMTPLYFHEITVAGQDVGLAALATIGHSTYSLADQRNGAWNHNSTLAVTVTSDFQTEGKVSLWDVSDKQNIFRVPDGEFPLEEGNPGARGCSFSPDGSLLAIGYTSTFGFKVYSTTDWSVVFEDPGSTTGSNTLHFSRDGSLVAYDRSSTIIIRRTSDWEVVHTVAAASTGRFSLSEVDEWFVYWANSRPNMLHVADWSFVVAPEVVPKIQYDGQFRSMAISPDKSVLLIRHHTNNFGDPFIVRYDTTAWRMLTDALPHIDRSGEGLFVGPDAPHVSGVGPLMAWIRPRDLSGFGGGVRVFGTTYPKVEYWNGSVFQHEPVTVLSSNGEVQFPAETWDADVRGGEAQWAVRVYYRDGGFAVFSSERTVNLDALSLLPAPTNPQVITAGGNRALVSWDWTP